MFRRLWNFFFSSDNNKQQMPPSELKDSNPQPREIEKTMDVMFVIDATGSMSATIQAAHDRASQIAVDLRVKDPDIDFRFGSVCYRDPIDCPNDEHQFLDLTDNIDFLVQFFELVPAEGGGDGPEDVYGALKITLERTSWRNGLKTIIFIADAPAHGHRYCGYPNHEDQNDLLAPLLKRIADAGIAFTGMSIDRGCDECLAKMKEDYLQGDGPDFVIEKIDLLNRSHATEKVLIGGEADSDDEELSGEEKDHSSHRKGHSRHGRRGSDSDDGDCGEPYHGRRGTDTDYIKERMGKRTMNSCSRQINRFIREKEYK